MTHQLFISYKELKEVMVFEDTEEREQTITYWHNYLAYLSKYEPGTILYGCHKYDVTFFNATK